MEKRRHEYIHPSIESRAFDLDQSVQVLKRKPNGENLIKVKNDIFALNMATYRLRSYKQKYENRGLHLVEIAKKAVEAARKVSENKGTDHSMCGRIEELFEEIHERVERLCGEPPVSIGRVGQNHAGSNTMTAL